MNSSYKQCNDENGELTMLISRQNSRVSKRTVFDKKSSLPIFGTNFAKNMSQIENKVGFRVKKKTFGNDQNPRKMF